VRCELSNKAGHLTHKSVLVPYSGVSSENVNVDRQSEAVEMTSTLPSKNGSAPDRRGGKGRKEKESAGGVRKHKRTATDLGLAIVTPLVGQEFLDRYNLRGPFNRGLQYGVKQVFSAAGAATRQFKRISAAQSGPTRLKKSGSDYFDLTPDDEQ